MPRNNESNISIAFPSYFRANNLLWIKNKKQFNKNYQTTYDSAMIFGYIFTNCVKPFKPSGAFFLCRPMRKHTTVINFLIDYIRRHFMRFCYVFLNGNC